MKIVVVTALLVLLTATTVQAFDINVLDFIPDQLQRDYEALTILLRAWPWKVKEINIIENLTSPEAWIDNLHVNESHIVNETVTNINVTGNVSIEPGSYLIANNITSPDDDIGIGANVNLMGNDLFTSGDLDIGGQGTGKGFFYDGARGAQLADGTNAGYFYDEGRSAQLADGTNAGYFYDGADAVTALGGSIALVVDTSGSGNIAITADDGLNHFVSLSNGSSAGYFTDGTRAVALADGSLAIAAGATGTDVAHLSVGGQTLILAGGSGDAIDVNGAATWGWDGSIHAVNLNANTNLDVTGNADIGAYVNTTWLNVSNITGKSPIGIHSNVNMFANNLSTTDGITTSRISPTGTTENITIAPYADGDGTSVGSYMSGYGVTFFENASYYSGSHSDPTNENPVIGFWGGGSNGVKRGTIGIDDYGRLNFGGTYVSAAFSGAVSVATYLEIYGTTTGFIYGNTADAAGKNYATFGGSNDVHDEPLWIYTNQTQRDDNFGIPDLTHPQIWIHDGSKNYTKYWRIMHNGTNPVIESKFGDFIIRNNTQIAGNLSSQQILITPALEGVNEIVIDSSRPNMVYNATELVGGVAYNIIDMLATNTDPSDTVRWGTWTVLGSANEGGGTPAMTYQGIDSRTGGAYDNATLKIDSAGVMGRVGVAISGTTRPTEAFTVANTFTVDGDGNVTGRKAKFQGAFTGIGDAPLIMRNTNAYAAPFTQYAFIAQTSAGGFMSALRNDGSLFVGGTQGLIYAKGLVPYNAVGLTSYGAIKIDTSATHGLTAFEVQQDDVDKRTMYIHGGTGFESDVGIDAEPYVNTTWLNASNITGENGDIGFNSNVNLMGNSLMTTGAATITRGEFHAYLNTTWLNASNITGENGDIGISSNVNLFGNNLVTRGNATSDWGNYQMINVSRSGETANVYFNVTKEIPMDVSRFKLPGTNYPASEILVNTPVLSFDKNTNESIYGVMHVIPEYRAGSDWYVAFYWKPKDAGAGNVEWCINITRESVGEHDSAGTNYCVQDATTETQYELLKTAKIRVDGSSYLNDDMIGFRPHRGASMPGDTFDDDAHLVSIQIYYNAYRLGEGFEA